MAQYSYNGGNCVVATSTGAGSTYLSTTTTFPYVISSGGYAVGVGGAGGGGGGGYSWVTPPALPPAKPPNALDWLNAEIEKTCALARAA